MLLPVGELTKPETRARARTLGLDVVADKVESQDICFVPDGDHTKIIARRLGAGLFLLEFVDAFGQCNWRKPLACWLTFI